MKARKDLKIIGYIFLFLALFDVVNVLIDYFNDVYSLDNIISIAGSDITQSVAKTALIILLVFVGIGLLIKIFFGVKAIKQSNGSKGTSHIVLAIIVLVISIISSIILIVSFIQKQATIYNVIVSLANIVIYASYIKAAKLVLKSEK